MQLLSSLILVAVILFITMIHELGHLALAKSSGVPVDVFAIGFGPNLYTYEDKSQTKWSINLIPLGGYISIATPDSSDVDVMLSIPPIKRIIVALGGPLFNIISFFLIGTLFYNQIGPSSYTYKEKEKEEMIIYKTADQYILFRKSGKMEFTPKVNDPMETAIKSQSITTHRISIGQSMRLCTFQCMETGKMIIATFTSLQKLKNVKSILSTTKNINQRINSGQQSVLEIFILYFILFSLSVGLFNLLPFFGLDGGWIFISIINLFVKFSKTGERILIRTLNYGTILLFTFMFFLVAKDLLEMIVEFLG